VSIRLLPDPRLARRWTERGSPISLVCRKGAPRDGNSLFLLYGYGSYEISADPGFSIPRLSLPPRRMNLNDFVKPPGRLVVAVRW